MKEDSDRTREDAGPATPQGEQSQRPEADPAQERGGRIAEGTHTARGGKTDGQVPGATQDKGAGKR